MVNFKLSLSSAKLDNSIFQKMFNKLFFSKFTNRWYFHSQGFRNLHNKTNFCWNQIHDTRSSESIKL